MSESLEKSVLDHVEVKDDAFPLGGKAGPEETAADAGTPAEAVAAGQAAGDGGAVGDVADPSLVERLAQAVDDAAAGKYQAWTVHCATKESPCRSFRPMLTRVGGCPKCGSPVYSSTAVEPGETPIVQRSCECFQTKGETVAAKKTPKAKAPAPAAPAKAAKVKSAKAAKKGKK